MFADYFLYDLPDTDNTIQGARGDDNISVDLAEVPNSLVDLDRGDDFFEVSNGSHIIYGGRGDDTIKSGDGDDFVSGGRGDDVLYGQGDDDTVVGDRGDDTLYGGTGDDILVGGRGEDIFVHIAGDNLTVIDDFVQGQDKIQLEFDGVTELAQVLAIAQDIQVTQNSITVVVDDNNILQVNGVGEDMPLTDSDFIFA